MPSERIFDVNWRGPCSADRKLDDEFDANRVLYMICGTHGLYGRNVPLYLGKTLRSIKQRMHEHGAWLSDEPDPVNVYAAYVGVFKSWEHNTQPDLAYPPLSEEEVTAVESLLILAHQPVYNARARITASDMGNIRLFNTGHRSTLFPEVSSLFWVGDAAAPGRRQPQDGVPKGKR